MTNQQVALTSTTSVATARKCKNKFLRILALHTFVAAFAFGALRALLAGLKNGFASKPTSLALRKISKFGALWKWKHVTTRKL
jgi:hypothetical protein